MNVRFRHLAGASSRPHKPVREIALFLLVGGTAALLYILIATLLETLVGLTRPWASAVAYGLMVPPAYAAQKRFTFRSSASHSRAFPSYLLTQFVALGVASVVSSQLGRLPPPLAYGIAGICAAIVSFVLLKFWGLPRAR